jgi:hypothetical protein
MGRAAAAARCGRWTKGREVTYGIRPEHLGVGARVLPGTVRWWSRRGRRRMSSCGGGREMVAVFRDRVSFRPGDPMTFAPAPDLFDKATWRIYSTRPRASPRTLGQKRGGRALLKGIDNRLNAEVLATLRAMGHGDVLIVRIPTFRPIRARATVTGKLLRMENLTCAEAVQRDPVGAAAGHLRR